IAELEEGEVHRKECLNRTDLPKDPKDRPVPQPRVPDTSPGRMDESARPILLAASIWRSFPARRPVLSVERGTCRRPASFRSVSAIADSKRPRSADAILPDRGTRLVWVSRRLENHR